MAKASNTSSKTSVSKGQMALEAKHGKTEVEKMISTVENLIDNSCRNFRKAFDLSDLEFTHLVSFDAKFTKSTGALQKGVPYIKLSASQLMNEPNAQESTIMDSIASACQEYLLNVMKLAQYSQKAAIEDIVSMLTTGEKMKEPENFEVNADDLKSAKSVEEDSGESKAPAKAKGNAKNLTPRKKQDVIISSPDGDYFLAHGGEQFKTICKNNGISNSGLYFQLMGNKIDHKGWVAAKVQEGLEVEVTNEETRECRIVSGEMIPYLKEEVKEKLDATASNS